MVDRGKGGGDGRDEEDGVGTGGQQEHQPLPPPLPLPPLLPPPPLQPTVGIRADPVAEQHALVVESRLVLAHRTLVSYEIRKKEKEMETVVEVDGQEEEGGEDTNNEQQQQGSKQVRGRDGQQYLQQGCGRISIEAGPRLRLGGGLMPPFSPD